MMPNGAEVIDSVLMKMEYMFIFYPGKVRIWYMYKNYGYML